jgi:hypothetical protein
MRSALIVKDETPASYLPDWTAGMMSPNVEGTHSTSRSSLPAIASKSSTSMPITVFPSASMNSFGA